ncbi:sulfatase family protein [Parasphaerochaeta coccoides]|uniref:Sulfatase n=1 Tax=Parasphaerochaeta coccoides (strain ATCC BAA-1237 / DSM 17374 / SPN1) TaxID=760011 RepID=F4GHQ2_PARC1|nr:arylsulfatase [Parasphaerochaeta coccoides]AEC01590.1 sulfatase [Parasphaerochaeta coccoides DSM 17374]
MKKPNVIYILADDMGYGDISRNNGQCPFLTPHLDKMCDSGMRFTDAHATSAVCTPSRYSLLTGRYNWRSLLKSSVIGGYSEPLIAPGRKTVAHMLREQGYRTFAIGKWHLGMQFSKSSCFSEAPDFAASDGIDYSGKIARSPIENGFDYYYGISASLDMPPYVYIENDQFTALPDHISQGNGKGFWRPGPTAKDFVHSEVLDHLTDKALDVLDKQSTEKNDPFFLYFPLPAPHTPILPSLEFQGKSGTNEYGDFVLHCDHVVGRITSKLKALGLLSNTIVVYTSDNGCSPMADYKELLEKGHNPSHVFRGTKADIYEGGHRVPLIIQWPDRIKAGTVCNRIVCLADFLATMADLLGVRLPDDMGEDSVSNLPLWLNPNHPEVRDDLIHQSIDGSLSIRMGTWKLEMCPGSGGWSYPRPGVDDTSSLPSFQLYNLNKDIGETTNVIMSHPDVFMTLRERLTEHIRNGRSTPGTRQKNDGNQIWDTVRWLEDM